MQNIFRATLHSPAKAEDVSIIEEEFNEWINIWKREAWYSTIQNGGWTLLKDAMPPMDRVGKGASTIVVDVLLENGEVVSALYSFEKDKWHSNKTITSPVIAWRRMRAND